jgi:hypothetical protein
MDDEIHLLFFGTRPNRFQLGITGIREHTGTVVKIRK